MVAFYPGPAGATESELPLPAWNRMVARDPRLAVLRPDVEALLVRAGARDRRAATSFRSTPATSWSGSCAAGGAASTAAARRTRPSTRSSRTVQAPQPAGAHG
jgi:hypothetical protein